jgi:hypothetical protein
VAARCHQGRASRGAITLDPRRELRAARAAFAFTPTAQNQMRLAAALLESGAAEEAARNYEACLTGPFAADPEIQLLAARAFFESGQAARAVTHLQQIQSSDAELSPRATRFAPGAGPFRPPATQST